MSNPLLIEIGFEELPAIPLLRELPNITDKFHASFAAFGFESNFKFYYTPRRFAFYCDAVPECGSDEEVEFFGPPLVVAFKDGQKTKAYDSFLAKNGLEESEVSTAIKDGKESLYAKKLKVGNRLADIVSEAIDVFLRSLVFGKTMLWGGRSDGFIRPLRWLVVMHGAKKLDAEVFSVTSGCFSYGHRQFSFDQIVIDSADGYFEQMRSAGVEIDQNSRKSIVLDQIAAIEKENGLSVEVDSDLLAEVVAITEHPKALLGGFDEQFLKVAPEIIITSMRENQRYFPLFKDGQLFNGFVVVSNAFSDDTQKVVRGNERVLKARLSDALFFWQNDLSKRLDPEPLKSIVFAAGLGSVYDKSMREATIAESLGELWGVKNIEDIKTAMHLAKADLLSEVVGEFGELQGVIGRYYAKNDGYSDEISTAIMEHYLPKGEDSALPSSLFSATCAIASKLDTVFALFSANMIPTGSKDPFALRRAAFGIVRIIIEFNLNFDIAQVISKFAHLYKPYDSSKVEQFMLDRVHQLFGEINSSIIASVVVSGERDVLAMAEKIEALDVLSKRDGFRDNFSTFKRVANISKDFDLNSIGAVDGSLFENQYEKALYDKFEACKNQTGSYFDELHRLFDLKAELDQFFDNCMVNAEDLKIRENRKNLIASIYSAFRKIADIKEISL